MQCRVMQCGVRQSSQEADGQFAQLRPSPRRFYDGGLPASAQLPEVAPDPERDPLIVLERRTEAGAESFRMERRIAYLDREFGQILVPADPVRFRTDLTSVPAFFTWLVPKTGAHLPAALVHDGLVDSGDDKSYVASRAIERDQADRVFRDAMADTGTGLVRRWIVWSAVTVATIFAGQVPRWSPLLRWWLRGAAAVTIIAIAYLGYCGTADLFDQTWPLARDLPWMGERPFLLEMIGGLAGAIAVPAILGLTWGRFWKAGVINGILLAVLLHVTIGVLLISGSYLLLEKLTRWAPGLVGVAVAAVVLASLVLTVALS